MRKLKWGVLSVAKIGTVKVIPAMQRGERSEVVGIASRDLGRAQEAAQALGIPKAYGSYDELLADPEIEAVYNPLPNHLHVEWSIRAAEAGKHVLCEKPIGLDAAEARKLLAARDRTGMVIQEAFMVRGHPQWLRAREIIRSGAIGELRAVQGFFSYFNADPANIRNQADIGGGGVYDIGCYPIVGARYLFEQEPRRVSALLERDPVMKTDRLASALMEFPGGQASWMCSTQLVGYQRLQAFGTKGRIELQIPFNAPPDKACRLFVDDGSGLGDASAREELLPVCDQYTIQGDLFSECVQEGKTPEFPLEDTVRNMEVIDAVYRSGATGQWVEIAV
ncbi:MAG: gfo/Idh/MocA family oxidoreductase [Acidobacteria bacterium]|nr:gfo/Idh/MocA family oxidoreductase [Acidobacteriota bacterium]